MALLKDVLNLLPKDKDGNTFLAPVNIFDNSGGNAGGVYEKLSDALECPYAFAKVERQEHFNDTTLNASMIYVDDSKLAWKVMLYLSTWCKENGMKKAVIGVSGGKDSTVCLKLCCDVLGPENVTAVLMPNGVQPDIQDSLDVCEICGVTPRVVNIHEEYLAHIHSLGYENEDEVPYGIRTNAPARLRMTTLYSIAAEFDGCAFVVNTCNRSEDFVGYSTKYGDGAGDVSLLGGLCVREVLALGDELGLPGRFVHKAPSDGMCGKTDEDNLGFTYETLDDFILNGVEPEPMVLAKILRLHRNNEHKLKPIPYFDEKDFDNVVNASLYKREPIGC